MSNRTPVAKNAKTKSAHNKRKFLLAATATSIILIVLLVFALYSSDQTTKKSLQHMTGETCITVQKQGNPGNCYDLKIAATERQRTLGLSDRESIRDDQAMLFEFDTPGNQCIWMKDMKFAIDIVWLDSKSKIIRLEEHVSPDTYPQTFCAQPAKQVIEVKAGGAQHINLQVGDVLGFSVID